MKNLPLLESRQKLFCSNYNGNLLNRWGGYLYRHGPELTNFLKDVITMMTPVKA